MKIFWCCFLMFALSHTWAEVSTLEDLTAQWVALRAERAREAEAWRNEEARMRLELSLLEEAEARLLEERDQLREQEDEVEASQADDLAELEARQDAGRQLGQSVAASRADLLAVLDALPPALRARLAEEEQALDGAEDSPLQQLRAVWTLRNQLTRIQHELHVTPAVIDVAGRRREMDVLWVGTARAFAVSGDDLLAAQGRPVQGTWEWEPLPGRESAVRRAVLLVRGEAAPGLVSLPWEVGE